jgi:hypothetical protein
MVRMGGEDRRWMELSQDNVQRLALAGLLAVMKLQILLSQ